MKCKALIIILGGNSLKNGKSLIIKENWGVILFKEI